MPYISIKKAVFLNALSKYSTIFFGIFFSAILARILTPADFGTLAIISVFTNLFVLLSNIGLGPAIIQYKNLTLEDINNIFSLTFYIGILSVFVFILIGFPISLFYDNRSYIAICSILSISIFFNIINTVPNSLLLREKHFFRICIRQIAVTVFTYVITIILALNGLRYYSLVFQSVLSSLLIFIWNIYHANLKIKLSIGISTFKKIAEYSGYHFAMSIFNYFSRNLDKMIIGKYMGNVNLAQYDRAYKFMLYPVQNITHVITPVLHPILSDYQDKLDDIYNKYLKLLKLLSIIGVFITLVCFWCSGEIILILYGNQWTQAVSIFKWMSLGILSQMLAGTAGAIYQSIGKPKQFFFITVLNTLVICIGIIIGIFFKDLEILSISISVCFNINIFIITFLLIKYGLRKKAGCFYFKFIPDILSLILISALMYFIINFIHIESLILSLLAKTSIIFFSYLLLLCLFRQVHYIRNTGVKYGE